MQGRWIDVGQLLMLVNDWCELLSFR